MESDRFSMSPIPRPWKTSFDLAVERLNAAGFKVEAQDRPDTYRVNGGQDLTRGQLLDFAINKGVLAYPPDTTTIEPRVVPQHEIRWDAKRNKDASSAS